MDPEQITSGGRAKLLNVLAAVCAVMQTILAILAVCLIPWVSSVNAGLESLNVNLARIDERIANIAELRAKQDATAERLRRLEIDFAGRDRLSGHGPPH